MKLLNFLYGCCTIALIVMAMSGDSSTSEVLINLIAYTALTKYLYHD